MQYFAAPDALYLFVVAAGGKFQVRSQAVPQQELYDLIRAYRTQLERAAAQRLPWADDGSEAFRRERGAAQGDYREALPDISWAPSSRSLPPTRI